MGSAWPLCKIGESGRWFTKTFNESLLAAIKSAAAQTEALTAKVQPWRVLRNGKMSESEVQDALRLLEQEQKAEEAFISARTDEGVEMLRAIASEAEQLGAKFRPIAASALDRAAQMHEKLRRFEEARELRLHVLQLYQGSSKSGAVEVASSYLDLAKNFELDHRNEEAFKFFKEAVNVAEAALKSPAVETETKGAHLAILIQALLGMAAMSQRKDDVVAASQIYERALTLAEELREPEMIDAIVEAYSMMLRSAGRTAEAQSVEQRAKVIRQKLQR